MEGFFNLYGQIGPAGLILIFFAFYGIYLGIKSVLYISLVKRNFKIDFRQFINNREDQTKSYKGDNPLLAIVCDVANNHCKHSSDIRAEVAYLFHRNFETISKNLYWIRLITIVSPLLGLLGTVFGMVDVFQAIASDIHPDPVVLAGGIWEALLTTAMGLSIAIPMLMLYYFLLLHFKGFHIEAIEYSYQAVQTLNKN